MTRAAAVAVLTLAALYTLFCLTLIFVGTFSTVTLIPGDTHGDKAFAFGIFSFFFVAGLWMGGGLLWGAADDKAAKK